IDGKVIFTLTSDDGAELMVTDASGRIIDPILNNDGVHGAQSKVLAMVISKGAQYKLWIRYFDDRDRAVLKLERQLVDRDNRIVSGQEIYRPESQFTLRFYDLQNLGTVTFPVPGSFFRRFHLDE